MGVGVIKLIMAGDVAVVVTRMETRFWFLMDISIEFTRKNLKLIILVCVK